MAELILFLRSREIHRVPVLSAEMRIGRAEDADLLIDNAGVSRTHAVVTYAAGKFEIRDESQNGITLNGKRVERAPLQFGDVIGINKYKVQFSPDGGVPLAMLEPPKQRAGGGPGNVVATMTVDAEAVRRIQEQFVAQRRKTAAVPAQRKVSRVNVVLGVSLALVLGLLALVMYQRNALFTRPAAEDVGAEP